MTDNIGAAILRYPLDLTGVNNSNLIDNEPHTLSNDVNRTIVPIYGPFFTESLVITDATTNIVLTKNDQYVAAQLIPAATARAGKEVCGVIVITDTNVSPNIKITYQVIGGPYILAVQALEDMLTALNLDGRPIYWADVLGKPNLFPVGHHLHDIGDIYGFEYLVTVLEDLVQAIINGDSDKLETIKAYFNSQLAAHIASHDHDALYYTKAQTYSQDQADALFMQKGVYYNAANIDGPLTIFQGGHGNFHITNYDAFSTYSVKMDNTTINWFTWNTDQTGTNNAFSITIPSNYPVGPTNFNVVCNGITRTLPVTIVATSIAAPVIIGTLSDTAPTLSLTSSAFSVTSGTDTASSSEVRITGVNSGTVVFDKTYTATPTGIQTSYVIDSLPLNTQLSVQVRYQGAIAGWGAWSTPLVITTKETYVVPVSNAIAKPVITLTDKQTNPEAITVACSAFTMITGSDSMVAYDYTISRNATTGSGTDYSNTITNIAATAAPTFDISNLDTSRTYNLTVRYKGASGEYSVWSDTTSITTWSGYIPATGATVSATTTTVNSVANPLLGAVTATPTPTNASGTITYQWMYVSGDTSFTPLTPATATTVWTSSVANATSVWKCMLTTKDAGGNTNVFYAPNVTVVSGTGGSTGSFVYPLVSVSYSRTYILSFLPTGTWTNGSDYYCNVAALPTPSNADQLTYTWQWVSTTYPAGADTSLCDYPTIGRTNLNKCTFSNPSGATTGVSIPFRGPLSAGTWTVVVRCYVSQGTKQFVTDDITINFTVQ